MCFSDFNPAQSISKLKKGEEVKSLVHVLCATQLLPFRAFFALRYDSVSLKDPLPSYSRRSDCLFPQDLSTCEYSTLN